ncbi:MAG: Asp-tRNA(Asn)/Glu-tRNA(Gln) amidotransferase subunit GatB, partial [Alphaproteobacteria bacterium]
RDPKNSYVDLNRSGVALMEIVSKPDIRSAKQAQAYVTKLRSILRYLGTCNGDMEEGSLRADVNVSVRRPGEPLGTRCEIKNMNSIRFIGQAIEYETRRQIDILEEGGEIAQQTRLFDTKTGETRTMRSKEEAHDYRYFPDPDLLPIEFTQAYVDDLAANLPELPDQKKDRFMAEWKLAAYDAELLVAEKERADYFEDMVRGGAEPKAAANWLLNQHLGRVNKEGVRFMDAPVSAAANTSILKMTSDGTISGKIAKELYDLVWETGEDPADLVKERGLRQVTDTGAIEKVVDEVIAANPKQVEQVKSKPQTLGWFVGQVMQKTGGKANPQAVNQLLREKLKIADD